jgi:glycosyltransferase involved in cell wall biosynthesis
MERIIIIGPAHPLRGGIATFNQRLAQQFIEEGFECEIISFSLQYPSLLFPGKTQFSSEQPPKGITIHSWINSVNPANWISVGKKIKQWKPDIVLVRFWLPFMGPALGTVLRQIRKNKHTKVICLADNVVPHEKRAGDKKLTEYFMKACDAFIVMSEKVMNDLRLFVKDKPAQLIPHPLYDNFGEQISKEAARKHLGVQLKEKIIVFFGFIRKYKGLDLLLQAMTDNRIRDAKIKLLIAGEFYEDEKPYRQLIEDNHLSDEVMLNNDFILDSEVKYYLCAADCVVQPYRNATQSGVTPLAYHFEKPMIVTNVGGLPDLVPHEKVGLVCEPQPQAIADAILKFYHLGEEYFIPQLRIEKKKYEWSRMTKAILQMAEEV